MADAQVLCRAEYNVLFQVSLFVTLWGESTIQPSRKKILKASYTKQVFN